MFKKLSIKQKTLLYNLAKIEEEYVNEMTFRFGKVSKDCKHRDNEKDTCMKTLLKCRFYECPFMYSYNGDRNPLEN